MLNYIKIINDLIELIEIQIDLIIKSKIADAYELISQEELIVLKIKDIDIKNNIDPKLAKNLNKLVHRRDNLIKRYLLSNKKIISSIKESVCSYSRDGKITQNTNYNHFKLNTKS